MLRQHYLRLMKVLPRFSSLTKQINEIFIMKSHLFTIKRKLTSKKPVPLGNKDIFLILVHTSHSAHTSHSCISSSVRARAAFCLWSIYDHAFGRKEHRSSRNRVLKCNSQHFCWINNSCFKEVFESPFFGIKTIVEIFRLLYFFYYSISLETCIICNLANRILDRISHDLHSNLFISIF